MLCEVCDVANGYGPVGDDCELCADKAVVVSKLVLFLLVTIFIIVNQIVGVRSRVNKILIQKYMKIGFDFPSSKLNSLSCIVKIFLNHVQITYLVVTFSFDIPFEVVDVFTLVGNPS